MRPGYVGEAWTGWLFSALKTAGFDVAKLTRGLPGISEYDITKRLEVGTARLLYHRLDKEANDPLLGYKMAQHLDVGATGFLSPLLWHSPTLGDILANISQFQWVLSENGGFVGTNAIAPLTEEPVHVFDYIPVDNAVVTNRHQILMLGCTTVQTIRLIMRHQCDIRWLNLPEGLNAKKISAALNCECRPRRGPLSVVFAKADLALPVSGRDAALYEVVRAHAEKATQTRAKRYNLVSEIKHHIRMRGFARASISQVESDLRIHKRTLQRLLQDANVSFRSLKQEVLRDEAIRRLANSSIADTAEALGYSEVSAFHRAFVQWFGKTPHAFLSTETYMPGSVQ